jgi:hypothetical protein
VWFILIIPIASACSSPAPTATRTPASAPTETTGPTETATPEPSLTPTQAVAPTETATPEPSLTPTQVVLDLEIIEWSEWPYGSPADPSNTDTHVEVLIRNPNDFPVRVDRDNEELRFINTAGEAVYTNPNPFFYIWQGEWMLPGEIAALSACVCFDTQGLEKQEWESLELVAPLEVAAEIDYTLDVEFTLGEVINLAEAHLGGNSLGIETFLTNTSDQVLESIPMRVLARDASGRYVGVATFGNAVVSFTENIGIQPGDTATGIAASDINYIDINVPLTYEAAAIGIPYRAAEATAQAALPSGTPLAGWNGIPIMPGAIAGEPVDGGYQFTTAANLAEITAFYETELSNLGFEVEPAVDETAGQALVNFYKEGTSGVVIIVQIGGGLHGVGITFNT